MKSKLTRILALIFALMLAVTMVSCTTTQGGKGGSTGTTGTSSGDAKGIDTSKFVTISHLSLGNKPTNGQYEAVKAEWDKYLKDKLNCALEVQYIGWTDYMTQYNLLLATGEGLDMINSASDWLEMWPNAQRGAFL